MLPAVVGFWQWGCVVVAGFGGGEWWLRVLVVASGLGAGGCAWLPVPGGGVHSFGCVGGVGVWCFLLGGGLRLVVGVWVAVWVWVIRVAAWGGWCLGWVFVLGFGLVGCLCWGLG